MTNIDIYRKRREQLIESMGTGVAIIKGAPEQTRSSDTDYPYRQDSDFFYQSRIDYLFYLKIPKRRYGPGGA